MKICQLQPATKSYLWGGEKLREWGKIAPDGPLAECWELSFNKEAPCLIASGEDQGRPLLDVATKEDIGPWAARFPFFPVLIKLIDAAKPLSVQVHPSDDYALVHEGQYGKTEMWRIISAEEGAGVYLGFKEETNREEVEKALQSGTILSLLNFFPSKAGDVYFIPSGTIHAIGAGITLLEIQQNSTLTYRLYDYGRLDKDGKPRQLHIAQALQVIDFGAFRPKKFPYPVIGECPYFQVREGRVDGEAEIKAQTGSFLSFTILSGEGAFDGLPLKIGETFFVPAGQKGRLVGEDVSYVLTEVKQS